MPINYKAQTTREDFAINHHAKLNKKVQINYLKINSRY